MRMHDSLRIMKRVAVKGVNAKRLLNWKIRVSWQKRT